MLNDKHGSYSVNSLLICAQAALLDGTASNHDVINLLDVAQDLISSNINSFTDSVAPGASIDLLAKEFGASNLPILSIGQRIRQARKSANLQQHHIASATGVTIQAVSLWENDLTIPTCDKIIPIANALKCDPLWLLTGNSPEVVE
ncbi:MULTISPECIES: helix-turn-helix domain-containing protein [Klebsiella]|uniref:helix-turn-helix domain-containing protein n=1 Tax=Klebsiella TaxID=570 RepID=UPI0007CD20D9|nr:MULTISPECIES: helix-turn-helix domain-containing protein [Klebsiella]EKX5081436.1 helix-turn-helix domain-containing protein [Klebsiella oxytoca]EKX5092878.1 helix-turn-helix domain-containing protein [Klebsiella oxytoca]ELQ8986969.1 helix-turn-helix domain-containing protein [Klebsiella oxytoca]MDM4102543.1 helix-turn-helix domain-containing protein [Klebsiella oxytoca]MDV1015107.1 helix-turn-helix domain-containing protein [Klebsiella grimontii]